MRTVLPHLTPGKPRARVSRSTVPRTAGRPVRFICPDLVGAVDLEVLLPDALDLRDQEVIAHRLLGETPWSCSWLPFLRGWSLLKTRSGSLRRPRLRRLSIARIQASPGVPGMGLSTYPLCATHRRIISPIMPTQTNKATIATAFATLSPRWPRNGCLYTCHANPNP